MPKYARSSRTIVSYCVARRPMCSNSLSVKHIHAGLLGLEYMIAAILPFARRLSSFRASLSPRKSWTSNSSVLYPSTLACNGCTENPGLINNMVSLSACRCVLRINDAKVPIIDPTVGTQLSGLTSMPRKALTNREACCLSGVMPAILGYLFATPASRACFWASMPIRDAGSPGEPNSRCTNLRPVILSSSSARARVCRMVASPA